MTVGTLSSGLFGDMFGTAAMRAAFGEHAFIAKCAEVEAALAALEEGDIAAATAHLRALRRRLR